ncbi:Insulin-degrading enzyme [Eumeta japonica]|uniref:Insulin-degrading enzyme n=1 Tax=Eumeta variegata TaxID=151549 RepID=A0A4C1T6B4_EUMVA|nr:Insulin-degrading enzyme [Eumeta japonica]
MKENHVRDIKNFEAEQPYQHATYQQGLCLIDLAWTKGQLLDAAQPWTKTSCLYYAAPAIGAYSNKLRTIKSYVLTVICACLLELNMITKPFNEIKNSKRNPMRMSGRPTERALASELRREEAAMGET